MTSLVKNDVLLKRRSNQYAYPNKTATKDVVKQAGEKRPTSRIPRDQSRVRAEKNKVNDFGNKEKSKDIFKYTNNFECGAPNALSNKASKGNSMIKCDSQKTNGTNKSESAERFLNEDKVLNPKDETSNTKLAEKTNNQGSTYEEGELTEGNGNIHSTKDSDTPLNRSDQENIALEQTQTNVHEHGDTVKSAQNLTTTVKRSVLCEQIIPDGIPTDKTSKLAKTKPLVNSLKKKAATVNKSSITGVIKDNKTTSANIVSRNSRSKSNTPSDDCTRDVQIKKSESKPTLTMNKVTRLSQDKQTKATSIPTRELSKLNSNTRDNKKEAVNRKTSVSTVPKQLSTRVPVKPKTTLSEQTLTKYNKQLNITENKKSQLVEKTNSRPGSTTPASAAMASSFHSNVSSVTEHVTESRSNNTETVCKEIAQKKNIIRKKSVSVTETKTSVMRRSRSRSITPGGSSVSSESSHSNNSSISSNSSMSYTSSKSNRDGTIPKVKKLSNSKSLENNVSKSVQPKGKTESSLVIKSYMRTTESMKNRNGIVNVSDNKIKTPISERKAITKVNTENGSKLYERGKHVNSIQEKSNLKSTKNEGSKVSQCVVSGSKTREATSKSQRKPQIQSGVPLSDPTKTRSPVHKETPLTSKDTPTRGSNLMTRKSGNSDIQSSIKRPISKPSSSTRSDTKTNRINNSKRTPASSEKCSGTLTHPSQTSAKEKHSDIKSNRIGKTFESDPNSNQINLEKCKNRPAEHKSKLIAPLARNVTNRVSKVSNQNSRSLSYISENVTHTKPTRNIGNAQKHSDSKLQKVHIDKLKKHTKSHKLDMSNQDQNNSVAGRIADINVCMDSSQIYEDFDNMQIFPESDGISSQIEEQLLSQDDAETINSGHLVGSGELCLSENIVRLQGKSSENEDQCGSGKISEFSNVTEESSLNSGDMQSMKQTRDGLLVMNDKCSVVMETVCAIARECSESHENGHSSLVNKDKLSPSVNDVHVLNRPENMGDITCDGKEDLTTGRLVEQCVQSSSDISSITENRLTDTNDIITDTNVDMTDDNKTISANYCSRKFCDKDVGSGEIGDTCRDECDNSLTAIMSSPEISDSTVIDCRKKSLVCDNDNEHTDMICTNETHITELEINSFVDVCSAASPEMICVQTSDVTNLEHTVIGDMCGVIDGILPNVASGELSKCKVNITGDICDSAFDDLRSGTMSHEHVQYDNVSHEHVQSDTMSHEHTPHVIMSQAQASAVTSVHNDENGINCEQTHNEKESVDMSISQESNTYKDYSIAFDSYSKMEAQSSHMESNQVTLLDRDNSNDEQSSNYSQHNEKICSNDPDNSDCENSIIYSRVNVEDKMNSDIFIDADDSISHHWSEEGCVLQQNDKLTDKNGFIKSSSCNTGASAYCNTDKSQNETPFLSSETILCKDVNPDKGLLDNSERSGNQTIGEPLQNNKDMHNDSNSTTEMSGGSVSTKISDFYSGCNDSVFDLTDGISGIDLWNQGKDINDVIVSENQGPNENSCQTICENPEVHETFNSRIMEHSDVSDSILGNKIGNYTEFVQEKREICDSNCLVNRASCQSECTVCVENDIMAREQCELVCDGSSNNQTLNQSDENDGRKEMLPGGKSDFCTGPSHSQTGDIPLLSDGKLINTSDDGSSVSTEESLDLSTPCVSQEINDLKCCQFSDHFEQSSMEKGCAVKQMDNYNNRGWKGESLEICLPENISSNEVEPSMCFNLDNQNNYDQSQYEQDDCEKDTVITENIECSPLDKKESPIDIDVCTCVFHKSSASSSNIQTANFDIADQENSTVTQVSKSVLKSVRNNVECCSEHVQNVHCSNCFGEKLEILDPDSEITLSETKNKCNVVKIAMHRDQTACIPENHGKLQRVGLKDMISSQYLHQYQECEAKQENSVPCNLPPNGSTVLDESIDFNEEPTTEEYSGTSNLLTKEETSLDNAVPVTRETEAHTRFEQGTQLTNNDTNWENYIDTNEIVAPHVYICDGADTADSWMSSDNHRLCQNVNKLEHSCSNIFTFCEDINKRSLANGSSSADPLRRYKDKNLESVQKEVISENVGTSSNEAVDLTQCNSITQMNINCTSVDQTDSLKNSNMDELTFKSPECEQHDRGSSKCTDDSARDQNKSRDTCLMCSTGSDARWVLNPYKPNIHRDFSGDQMTGLSPFEFTSQNSSCNQVFSEYSALDRDIPGGVSANRNSGQIQVDISTQLNKSDTCTCIQDSEHTSNICEINKGKSGCVCNIQAIKTDQSGVLIKGLNFNASNNTENQSGDFEGNQPDSLENIGYHFNKTQTFSVHSDEKTDLSVFDQGGFSNIIRVNDCKQVSGEDDVDGQISTKFEHFQDDTIIETCTECELSSLDNDNRILTSKPDGLQTDKSIIDYNEDRLESVHTSYNESSYDLIAGNLQGVSGNVTLIGDRLVDAGSCFRPHIASSDVCDVVTKDRDSRNFYENGNKSEEYEIKQTYSSFLKKNKFIKSTSLSSLKTGENKLVDDRFRRSTDNLYKSVQLSLKSNNGKLHVQSTSSQICDNAGEALCDNVSDITDIFDDSGDNFVDAEETVDSEVDTTDIDITNSSSCASDLYQQGDALPECDTDDGDTDVTSGIVIDAPIDTHSCLTDSTDINKCRESFTSTESFQDALDNFVEDSCSTVYGNKTPENESNMLQTSSSLPFDSQTNVTTCEVDVSQQCVSNETDSGIKHTFADDIMERRRSHETPTKSSIVTGSSFVNHVHASEFRNSSAINDNSYQFYTASSGLKETTQSIIQTNVLRSTDIRNESGHRVIENVIYKTGNRVLPVESNSPVPTGEKGTNSEISANISIESNPQDTCGLDDTLYENASCHSENVMEKIKHSHVSFPSESTLCSNEYDVRSCTDNPSSAPRTLSSENQETLLVENVSTVTSSEKIGKRIETAVTIRTQRRRRRQVQKTSVCSEQNDQSVISEPNKDSSGTESYHELLNNRVIINESPKIESENSSDNCSRSESFKNETESVSPLSVKNTKRSAFNDSSAASCSIEIVPGFNSILSSDPKSICSEDQQTDADTCDKTAVLTRRVNKNSWCESSSVSAQCFTKVCGDVILGDTDIHSHFSSCLSCPDSTSGPEVTPLDVYAEEPTFTVSVQTLPTAKSDNNFDDIAFIDADDVPEVAIESTTDRQCMQAINCSEKSESPNASFTLTFEIASDDETHNIEIVCENERRDENEKLWDLKDTNTKVSTNIDCDNEVDLGDIKRTTDVVYFDKQIHSFRTEGSVLTDENAYHDDKVQDVGAKDIHSQNKIDAISDINVELSEKRVDISDINVIISDNTVDISDNNVEISNSKVHTLNNKVELSDNNVHTSDNKVEISDKNVHTSDNKAELSDNNVHTSDNKVEILENKVPELDTFNQLDIHVSSISDSYTSDIISPCSQGTDNDGDDSEDMDSVVSEESNISVAHALKRERDKLNVLNNNCANAEDYCRSRSRTPHAGRNIRSASTGNFLLQLQHTETECENVDMFSNIKAGLTRKSIKKSSSFRIDRQNVYSPVEDGSQSSMETVKTASKRVSDMCRSFVQKARSTSRPREDKEESQVKSPTPQRKLMKWVNDNGKWLRIPVNESLGDYNMDTTKTSQEARPTEICDNNERCDDIKQESDIPKDKVVCEKTVQKVSETFEKSSSLFDKSENDDTFEQKKTTKESTSCKIDNLENEKTTIKKGELKDIKVSQTLIENMTFTACDVKTAPTSPREKDTTCLSQHREDTERSSGNTTLGVQRNGNMTPESAPGNQEDICNTVKLEVGPAIVFPPTKPKPKLQLDIQKANEQTITTVNIKERPNTAPIELHCDSVVNEDNPVMNRNDFLLGVKDNISRRKLVKMLSPTRCPQVPDFVKIGPNKDETPDEQQVSSPKRIPKLTAVKIQEEIYEGNPEYMKQCNIDPLGMSNEDNEPENISTFLSHRKSRQFKDIKKSKTFTSIEEVKHEQDLYLVSDTTDMSMRQCLQRDNDDTETVVSAASMPPDSDPASERIERKTTGNADKRKIKVQTVQRDRSLQRPKLLSEIVEVEENKDELQQPANNNKSNQRHQQQQPSNNKKERTLKKSGTIGNKRRSLSLPTGSLAFGDARIVYKNGHFTIETMDGFEIDSSHPNSDDDNGDPNIVNEMHVTADASSRRREGVVVRGDTRETIHQSQRPGLKRQCAKTVLTKKDSGDSVFYSEQDDISELNEQASESCSTSSLLSEMSMDSQVSVDSELDNFTHDRHKSHLSSSSLPETGSSPTVKQEALRARRTSSFRRAQAGGALSLAEVKEEQTQQSSNQKMLSSDENVQNSPSAQKSTPKRKALNENMNLFSKQSESAKDFFSKRMNLKGLFKKNKSDLGLAAGSPLKTQHPISPPIAAFQGDDDIGSIDTPPGSPGPKQDYRRRHTSADIYIKSFADASASESGSNCPTPTQERHNVSRPTVSTPTTPSRESNSIANLALNGSVCSVDEDRISVTSASSAASSSHSIQSPGMEQPNKPKTPKPVGASPRRSHSICSQSSRTSYLATHRDRPSTSVTSLESDNCDSVLSENVIVGHCECEHRMSRPRLRSDGNKTSIDSVQLCHFCRQCLEYANSAGLTCGAYLDKQRKYSKQNSLDDNISAKMRKDSTNRTSYEKLAIISQTAVVSSNSNDSGIQRDVSAHSSNESIKGSQDNQVKLRRKKSLSPHTERPKSEAGVRWADLDLESSQFSQPVRLRNRAHNFKDRPRPKSDFEGSSYLSERMKAFGSDINLQPYCSLRNLYEKKQDFDKRKNRRMSTPHPIKSRLQRSPKKLQKQPPLVRSSSMPESLDKISKRRKLHLLDYHMDSLQRHLDAEDCFSDDSDLSFDQASLQERSLSVQSSQSQLTSMDEDEDNLIYAEALWDHITMVPDEIGFRAQDVIEVMDMRDKDWWYGAIDDNEGWFPAAFVRLRVNQEQVEEEDLEMTLQENLTSSPKSRRISMINKNQARTNVVNEIINAEREYVKHLKDVVEGYIQHARKRSEMFPEDRIALIFGNIETIYAYARKFLVNLEKCIDVCPHLSEIGQCFLDTEKGFEVYSDYCNNHPSACEELKELCRDSKYRHFFEACRLLQELVEIPLEGFLLTPVQKICKYPLQLAELLKYTPPDHPDYTTVKDALLSMRKIATLINERKRKMESIEKIAAWQHTVADWDGEDLLDRSSELIFSGDISKVNTAGWSQERYFFLFDHQLIYCKKELLKRHVFSYKGRIDLDNCEVLDIPDGRDVQYNVSVKHAWKLHETHKNKWYLLYGKTQAVKQKWLKALTDERNRVQEDKDNDFCVPDYWKQTVLNKVRSQSSFKDKQPASRINPNHQVPIYQKDLKDFTYSTLPRRRINSQKQDTKKKGWFIFGGKKSKR